jgi:hypothetical protein
MLLLRVRAEYLPGEQGLVFSLELCNERSGDYVECCEGVESGNCQNQQEKSLERHTEDWKVVNGIPLMPGPGLHFRKP